MFFHKKSPGFRRSSPISFINDDVETYIPICFAKFLLFRNLLCEVFQPKEPQYRRKHAGFQLSLLFQVNPHASLTMLRLHNFLSRRLLLYNPHQSLIPSFFLIIVVLQKIPYT